MRLRDSPGALFCASRAASGCILKPPRFFSRGHGGFPIVPRGLRSFRGNLQTHACAPSLVTSKHMCPRRSWASRRPPQACLCGPHIAVSVTGAVEKRFFRIGPPGGQSGGSLKIAVVISKHMGTRGSWAPWPPRQASLCGLHVVVSVAGALEYRSWALSCPGPEAFSPARVGNGGFPIVPRGLRSVHLPPHKTQVVFRAPTLI